MWWMLKKYQTSDRYQADPIAGYLQRQCKSSPAFMAVIRDGGVNQQPKPKRRLFGRNKNSNGKIARYMADIGLNQKLAPEAGVSPQTSTLVEEG